MPSNTLVLGLVPGLHGSIGPYVGAAGVYRCPADSSWVLWGGARTTRVRSYSMNRYLGYLTGGFPEGTDYRVFAREAELHQLAAKIFVFMDEHEDTIQDGIFEVPMEGDGFFSLPAFRHSGGSVVTFATGSVELHRWKDARTKPPVQHKHRYGGWLSPGNPDCEWLRRHTTVRK